jgi:isoamylase
MNEEDWERDDAHTLGVFLNGQEIPTHDRDGNPIQGASFPILFNAYHDPIGFFVPGELAADWKIEISIEGRQVTGSFGAGEQVPVLARSVVVLRRL